MEKMLKSYSTKFLDRKVRDWKLETVRVRTVETTRLWDCTVHMIRKMSWATVVQKVEYKLGKNPTHHDTYKGIEADALIMMLDLGGDSFNVLDYVQRVMGDAGPPVRIDL